MNNLKFDIALSFAFEEQKLVEKVYHYLKAEGLSVFYSPALECQSLLSGKNQREIFYYVFGMISDYAALFVSKNYIVKDVPMEEASIAFAKHSLDGKVIPIYLDNTPLPPDMLDPKSTNYFTSNNPAIIASHIALKIKSSNAKLVKSALSNDTKYVMNINGNKAEKQLFIQNMNGSVEL